MLNKSWFQGIAKKATLTIETPKANRPVMKPHYTFQVRRQAYSGVASVYLMTGRDNYSSYTLVGRMDLTTGSLKPFGTLFTGAVAVWNGVVCLIFQGLGNALEDDGWTVSHDGRCCHCGHKLTNPASLATGVGPECEHYLKLGVKSLGNVPFHGDRQVAQLQYAYWCQAIPATLVALHDAALDAGFTEERAGSLVALTKKAARKFKNGKGLSRQFLDLVRQAA